MMYVAPTEPSSLRAIGKTSSIPEQFGSDVFFTIPGFSVGVQRKEYMDLLASLHDGRLQKEIAQLKRVSVPVVIIEGKPTWTLDGYLITRNNRSWSWTRKQHHNLILSLQTKNIIVQQSDSLNETIEILKDMSSWLEKSRHDGLDRRPKPKGSWGKATSKEFAKHILQGFDGLGPVQADAIIEHFGGIPLAWLVTEQQLTEVPGIGPKRARSLIKALEKEQAQGN